jgi:Na+/proline symporter
MPHGLRGLLLAAVASAAMGSANSAIMSLSTAFTVDFYKPFWGQDANEEKCVKVSRMAFIGFGIIFILIALIMHRLDNILWLAFRIIPFTYGPLLGVFIVAIMTDWQVPSRKLMKLMFSTTLVTSTMAILAWQLTSHGCTSHFWTQLHKYWNVYSIFGTLTIPIGAYFMRESNG